MESNERLFRRLDYLASGQFITNSLFRVGHMIRTRAIENLNKPTSHGEVSLPTSNSGELAKKIEVTSKGKSVFVISSAPYSAYVEFGTRPHYPPSKPLIKYVRRKYKLSQKEAVRRGYALQKYIGKHGTKARPFFKPAVKSISNADISKIVFEELKKAII